LLFNCEVLTVKLHSTEWNRKMDTSGK